jgi:hypothetical protein
VGLYFIRFDFESEYKKNVPIEAMYGTVNSYKKDYHLLENYFFMENILTSSEPTLDGFDGDGTPYFLPETRSDKQLENLSEIHRAVLDYIKNTEIKFEEVDMINKDIPDLIFSFLREEYCIANLKYFEEERLTDDFCSRVYDFRRNTKT